MFLCFECIQSQKKTGKGGFFINSWYKDGLKSVQDIQSELSSGDTRWIDKITYFSKKIKGSAGFWRHKRDEVYAWINHHIAQRNGPPNFFITLSCAEYHWPDIKRLIKERHEIAGLPDPDLEKSYVKLVNEYTYIVQEYFQKRVEIWLETVGKVVFKIKHYWLRFEFAASRGQIHAHMLAISDHNQAFQRCNVFANGDKRKKSRVLEHLGAIYVRNGMQ